MKSKFLILAFALISCAGSLSHATAQDCRKLGGDAGKLEGLIKVSLYSDGDASARTDMTQQLAAVQAELKAKCSEPTLFRSCQRVGRDLAYENVREDHATEMGLDANELEQIYSRILGLQYDFFQYCSDN